MDFQRVNLVYFSPTGGSKKIMRYVSSVFNINSMTVDISNPSLDFSKFVASEDEISIFAVPSFGGRVPETFVERIKKTHGNNSKAILISTYGNRDFDDTLLELKNVVKDVGFLPIAAIAAVSKHSIMTDIASTRPDELDKKEIISFAEKIKKHLENIDDNFDLDVPGNFPYKKYNPVPLKPKADNKCILCGACATDCPVGAIPYDTPNITNNELCITCMRCVEICPVGARSIGEENLKMITEKFGPLCEGRKENKLFIENLNK